MGNGFLYNNHFIIGSFVGPSNAIDLQTSHVGVPICTISPFGLMKLGHSNTFDYTPLSHAPRLGISTRKEMLTEGVTVASIYAQPCLRHLRNAYNVQSSLVVTSDEGKPRWHQRQIRFCNAVLHVA
jgi:hypothetical protein